MRILLPIMMFFCSYVLLGQEKPKMERFLNVSPSSVKFEAKGGSKNLTVNSIGTWKISSSTKKWLHLTKEGNILKLRVDENTGASSRNDSFELTSGDKKVRVSITQSGNEVILSVTSDEIQFSSSEETQVITVTTNGSWIIDEKHTYWLHPTKSGNRLSIRVDQNNSAFQRSGNIIIKVGNTEKSIDIFQQGNTNNTPQLSVSSDNLMFNSSGGTQTVTITSNRAWQIGTNTVSWGHPTINGNKLSVKVDPNNSTSTRTDWFTVISGNKEKRIYISQSGSSANLSVSSESLSFTPSGGTQTITITTNGSWQIGTNTASWAHLVINGNKLIVKIDSNPFSFSRSDWFTVKVGNVEKRIKIFQAAGLSTSSNNQINRSAGSTQTSFVREVNAHQSRKYRKSFNQPVDEYIGGFSVGYIQKKWEYNQIDANTVNYNKDEYLKGLQVGIRIDPQFICGLGLNTGVFYEYCWANDYSYYYDYSGYEFSHFDFTYKENGLYIPLHLKFTMNFSKWFQFSVYGGIGLNFILSGESSLNTKDETYEWDIFKEDGSWNRFNTMLEYGVSIKINRIQFDCTMSRGLSDWTESSDYIIKMKRPFSISATICF